MAYDSCSNLSQSGPPIALLSARVRIGSVSIGGPLLPNSPPNWFDELSRDFANGVSRRSVLKSLALSSVGSIFGSIGLTRPRIVWAAQSQTCKAADINACVSSANDRFDTEVQDCQDLPNQPARTKCVTAARQRHNASLKACDPCPSGTRCESDLCCPNSQATCAPVCGVSRDQNSQVIQFTKSLGSLVLSQRVTFTSSTGDAVDTTVISRNSTPLLTMELHRSRQGSGKTVFNYGSLFTGIKHAEVSTSDGNSFVALIDGKSTGTYTRGSDLGSVRFQDGTLIPAVGSTEPGLVDQITALFDQMVSSGATNCAAGTDTLRPFDTFPGCDVCTLKCGGELLLCEKGAAIDAAACAAVCIFLSPICAGVSFAICDKIANDCTDACNAPGHACCPTSCPGNHCCGEGNVCCGPTQCCAAEACCGNFCCSVNQKCVDPNQGICCATDAGPVCGNSCCSAGQFCADPGRQICCPPQTVLCGLGCCPTGQLCINNSVCCDPGSSNCGGQCCPAGVPCIIDVCCAPPGNRVCGGVCCGSLFACCNDVCCGANDLCVNNNLCCPRDQVCGNICCPSGQKCQNPATQTCAACPAGTAPCVSVGPNGGTVSICCPPGANCCAGQCCTDQTGHECTGPGGTCGTIH